MAVKVGVKVNPHILAQLFRAGAVICGEGYRIRLVENAVPPDLDLVYAGQDPDTREFVFIFGKKNEKVSGPVSWLTPTYEKEAPDGANS